MYECMYERIYVRLYVRMYYERIYECTYVRSICTHADMGIYFLNLSFLFSSLLHLLCLHTDLGADLVDVSGQSTDASKHLQLEQVCSNSCHTTLS